jgi:hypothetical protein
LTAKAIQTYHEIFDNEDGAATLRDRKDVADTVLLELSGLRTPTKIHTSNINMTLTPEEIESFKNRGIKAAKESGFEDVVDITPEPNAEHLCKALSLDENNSDCESINNESIAATA